MNKLRLDLDDIKVDSFATNAEAELERGQVLAHSGTTYTADINCYTNNPKYYDCTAGDPCTGFHCTQIGTCITTEPDVC